MKKLSASQVSMYQECPRKWAWKYIAKLKEPTSISMELGNRVHDILEGWLTTGDLPDLFETFVIPADEKKGTEARTVYPGQIAQAGLHLLPPPGTGELEKRITFEVDGVSWVGIVDGWYPHIPLLLDHKTTGDFKWMAEKDLETDVQSNLYAYWAMQETGLEEFPLRWVYYRTSGKPEAKPLEHKALANNVKKVVDRCTEDGKVMLRIYESGVDPRELPPNVDMCERYGGCPYTKHCNLDIGDLFEATMAKISLQEMLEQKIRDKSKVNGALEVAPTVQQIKPANENQPSLAEYGPINPPEAPKPVASPEQMPLHTVPAELTQIASTVPLTPVKQISTVDGLDGLDRAALKELAVKHKLTHSGTKFGEVQLRKVLRANGITAPEPEPVQTELQPDTAAHTETVRTEIRPEAVSEVPVALTAKEPTLALYINCIPVRARDTKVMTLSDFLGPIFDKMSKDGVLDYKLEDYGKGVGRLNAELKAYLASDNRKALADTLAIIVDTGTQAGKDTLCTLEQSASEIVRGF